jgi:hypothetical protein
VIRIELLDRLEQSLVADSDELGEVESVSLVLLDVGDDEPEVGGDQPFRSRFIPGDGSARQTLFFVGVGDHREFLNVEQILVEGAGRSRASKWAGFSGAHMRHRQPRQRERAAFCYGGPDVR